MAILVHSPGAPFQTGRHSWMEMVLPRVVTSRRTSSANLAGHPVAAPPPDFFDIKLGEDDGHPERLTTSAGQRSAFEGSSEASAMAAFSFRRSWAIEVSDR